MHLKQNHSDEDRVGYVWSYSFSSFSAVHYISWYSWLTVYDINSKNADREARPNNLWAVILTPQLNETNTIIWSVVYRSAGRYFALGNSLRLKYAGRWKNIYWMPSLQVDGSFSRTQVQKRTANSKIIVIQQTMLIHCLTNTITAVNYFATFKVTQTIS